jgi:hypothetical protein
MAASCVFASLKGSMYSEEYALPLRWLWLAGGETRLGASGLGG